MLHAAENGCLCGYITPELLERVSTMRDEKPPRTFGQSVVDVDSAATGEIAAMKQAFADVIDKVIELESAPNTHRQKCQMRAIEDLETACMYAVKAMTRPL